MTRDNSKLARFESGVPADPTKNMSEEDAAAWKAMNEKHRDKFKKASLARRVVSKFRKSRVASLNDTQTLGQLIEMEVESMTDELPRDVQKKAIKKVKVTPEVKQKAVAWDAAVSHVLTNWCGKHMSFLTLGEEGPLSEAETSDDVVEVMMGLRGGAGYLYYMEHEGHGVGTWDGDWDVLFKTPSSTIKTLSQYVLAETKQAYNALHEAIFDAALDTMPDEGTVKEAAARVICPKCHSPMVPAHGMKGVFTCMACWKAGDDAPYYAQKGGEFFRTSPPKKA